MDKMVKYSTNPSKIEDISEIVWFEDMGLYDTVHIKWPMYVKFHLLLDEELWNN